MIATWNLGQSAPKIRGTHKAGTPRRWTITVRAEHDGTVERMTIRADKPCTLHDLHDLVMSELGEFKDRVGEFTGLWWQAVAR